MPVHIALGVGAGVASALLFAAAGTGSLAAALLLYLTPLPILIVALGWHHLLGLLALSAGALAASALVRPSAGLAFALGPALSGWVLAWLALLRHPDANPRAEQGPAPAGRWYPVGPLLLWVAIVSTLVALGSLLATTGWDYDRYREMLEQTAAALLRREARLDRSAPLPPSFGFASQEFIRIVVAIAPALLAGMLTLILAANLWLAGKVVAISGRLARPWPDISGVRMPVTAIFGAVAGLVVGQVQGFVGIGGTAFAGGILMAFALQGLALLHTLSRGRSGRGLILSLAYVLVLLLGYIFLPVFALVGMADSALPLRRSLGGGPPLPPRPGTHKE